MCKPSSPAAPARLADGDDRRRRGAFDAALAPGYVLWMTGAAFEKRLLEMWVTTRIPLTRPNIVYFTGATRKEVDKYLDGLVSDGVLEVDADDDGEMIWAVRGAKRSTTGPTTLEEVEKVAKLRGEIASTTALARTGATALASALGAGNGRRARGSGAGLSRTGGDGRKSLIASGALSFFFGPLGWLYAAPLKEALPAITVYLLLAMILPKFLFLGLLGIIQPVSALAGILYALKHNANGQRTPLLPKGSDDDGPKRLPR